MVTKSPWRISCDFSQDLQLKNTTLSTKTGFLIKGPEITLGAEANQIYNKNQVVCKRNWLFANFHQFETLKPL